MKKILTEEEKSKKTRKNQIIIGVILVALMIFSTAGYSFISNEKPNTDNTSEITYKNIKFTKTYSDYWQANINNHDYIFKYNPEQTKNISFFISNNYNSYVGNPLYLAGDLDEAKAEISRNLGPYASRMQEACLNNEQCNGDFPIKNCSIDNVIAIELSNSSSIYQKDNCILINTNTEDQTLYADAFLFKILGI
jgi:hypothetical protein